MITAKVKLQRKEPNGEASVRLVFVPDYADGRNAEWAYYTPGLMLDMTVKGEVADRFEQGGAYTLQFVEES
jgi:hypothetical protein